ncbi:MAG TPA: zf-TFIIB domain-containing protein [Nocardioidaceae bacterium]|nr:zf-TFIIB domain-containing protein [Nocardioidaceae bacterium]
MDDMTCPKCQGSMKSREIGGAVVAKCSSCSGIFLERADAGALSESENDWHIHSGPITEPLPRITADMAPPPPGRPRARSFVETLFDA